MKTARFRGRILLGLVVAGVLSALQGCTYFSNRGNDAADMFDLGLTFSAKPQIGLYVNCPVILPIGYGKVDGYYAGVGGGKVGVMEHHQQNTGLLFWGSEKNTWQEPGKSGSKAVEDQQVGLLGLAEGKEGDAPYRVACKHYFHLGWVGVTANITWVEIPDFLIGWFGLDICGDDDRDAGKEPEPAKAAPAPPTPSGKPDRKEHSDGK